jgi:general secretion pathway protein G
MNIPMSQALRTISSHGFRTRPGRTVYRLPCRPKPVQERSRQAGFSLLELLVVLAILALLAGLVAPRVIGYLGGAKTDTAKLQLRNIESALDLYRLDVGKYPASLDALVTQPGGEERWKGPYLKKATGLTDPWGEPFKYRLPGEHGEYDLYSLGADKTEGGDGEDQDVRSW